MSDEDQATASEPTVDQERASLAPAAGMRRTTTGTT